MLEKKTKGFWGKGIVRDELGIEKKEKKKGNTEKTRMALQKSWGSQSRGRGAIKIRSRSQKEVSKTGGWRVPPEV